MVSQLQWLYSCEQSTFSQIQVDAVGSLGSTNQNSGMMTINVSHSVLTENTVLVDTDDKGIDSIKAMGVGGSQ